MCSIIFKKKSSPHIIHNQINVHKNLLVVTILLFFSCLFHCENTLTCRVHILTFQFRIVEYLF